VNIVEEIVGEILIEIITGNRASVNDSEILKEVLSKNIEKGYKKIIIDLTECEFIDSTFLGVLVNSLRKAVKSGGDLKLVGFKPAVKSMFELTRLFRVFETYGDLQDAIKSYTQK
jgi:anti-anti-sigma factor